MENSFIWAEKEQQKYSNTAGIKGSETLTVILYKSLKLLKTHMKSSGNGENLHSYVLECHKNSSQWLKAELKIY